MASKLKDNRYSTYLDIVKIRLIIDTKKDRSDFSSSTEGKVTDFGRDLKYVDRDGTTREKNIFSIADACQDICLNLPKSNYPVYLPKEIYGIGKMPIGWDTRVWYSAIKTQKQSNQRIIYETIRECLGLVPRNLTLRNGIIKFDKHFDNETYTAIRAIPEDHPIAAYRLCQTTDLDKFPVGLVEKLVHHRRLVPETEVSRHLLLHEHLASLQEGVEEQDLFEDLKVFCTTVCLPTESEALELLKTFREMYYDRPWMLKQFKQQAVYTKEVIQALRNHDPLAVRNEYFIPNTMKILVRDNDIKVEEGKKTRHERHVDALEEFFLANFQNIIDGDLTYLDRMPRDILADDPLIYKDVLGLPDDIYCVIIVTDDRRLAHLIESESSKVVVQIKIKDWFMNECDEDKFLAAINEFWSIKRKSIKVYIDQGSMEAYGLKTDYCRKDRKLPRLAFQKSIEYESLREAKNFVILEDDTFKPIGLDFLTRYTKVSNRGIDLMKKYQSKYLKWEMSASLKEMLNINPPH